jgi:Skp family chaperone for outer membrane proteins
MTSPKFFRSPLTAAAAIGLSLVAAVSLRSSAEPAPSLAPQPVTVALVDLAKLMNGLHEIAKRNKDNQDEGETMQKDLTRISDQVEKLRNDLKQGGAIPESDHERRAQAMVDFIKKSAELKSSRESYQNLYDTKRGNIIHDLYDKIILAIDAFAKREGYDLVLLDDRAIELPPNFAATAAELNPIIEKKRILYAKDGMDVTDRLITIMNNQWDTANPGSVPPPAPAPAPAPTTTPKTGNK